MRDPFVCTLNRILSPSLLSSYDLGAAAVVMNAVPVTHVSGESRIRSLDDDSRTEIARTRRHGVEFQHRDTPTTITGWMRMEAWRVRGRVAATILELGGLRVGLLGVCTTSTPLSSAVKPRGWCLRMSFRSFEKFR